MFLQFIHGYANPVAEYYNYVILRRNMEQSKIMTVAR